jgi:23S rRNA pseudouridine2605 synthase
MSLAEGKNREVRRVLAHLGLQVSRLIRTAYGPLTLEGLEPGDADELEEAELEAFRRILK